MLGANGSGSPPGNWSWRKDGDGRKHWKVDRNRRVERATGSSLESTDNSADRNAKSSSLEELDSGLQNRMTNDTGNGPTGRPQSTPDEQDKEIHRLKCMIDNEKNLLKIAKERLEYLKRRELELAGILVNQLLLDGIISEAKLQEWLLEDTVSTDDVGVALEGGDTPLDDTR